MKTDNSSLEKVGEFKYLGTTLTQRNSIQEEIKGRLTSGNSCYYSGSESFVFQVAIQKFKDEDIQNFNFAYCFYGCETWSLTLREERRVRLFEYRVLRR